MGDGCGCPKTLPAALFLAVGAVGPLAAARPRESGQSYAATGFVTMAPKGLLLWTHSGWSSTPLRAHLVWATGAPGVEVLCDLIHEHFFHTRLAECTSWMWF